MNIIVLTSSRAEYGIYLPLLKKLKHDPFFTLKIAAFGTHLSEKHGQTIRAIQNDGFEIAYQVNTPVESDSPAGIAGAMSATMHGFAHIWEKEKGVCDLIICLGDRFEMFAAVAASVPFVIPVAHIHGGETTLGAIDNKFRHALTMMSEIHFTSTAQYAARVKQMTGSKSVYNVGALSLDNIGQVETLSREEFKHSFGIELHEPILVTFHPETVAYDQNAFYIKELTKALENLEDQLVVTMPNADTCNQVIREGFMRLAARRSNVKIVESLGTQGYFTCMRFCSMVLGNSSSGIIEAASFGKYVVNLGNRQSGRAAGKNVIHCEIDRQKILEVIEKVKKMPALDSTNIYAHGGAADQIIEVLKKLDR